jgi:hypothetical protein
MFNIHTDSIRIIREWLDDVSYPSLNRNLMKVLDERSLYPGYQRFMGMIDRMNPLYAFIFSVFRFGQPAEKSYLNNFLPAEVVDALFDVGLLVRKDKFSYGMPQMGILPLEGMYFVTGLPENYPTVPRNHPYKPVDESVRFIIDGMNPETDRTDFLEFYAGYGIFANIAVSKGFKKVQICPKYADYIPFIQLNLALNHHEAEIITDAENKKYDFITCVHLSVREKIESKRKNISDENDIIRSLPVLFQLKENGQAMVLLESVGSIGDIHANKIINEQEGMNIKSVVLEKMPYLSYAASIYSPSSWEKQFELYPQEHVEFLQKTAQFQENNLFVFRQLIKIHKDDAHQTCALYPFYNPKYSDPVYNYASLTI